jgi:hypothetical protein
MILVNWAVREFACPDAGGVTSYEPSRFQPDHFQRKNQVVQELSGYYHDVAGHGSCQ